MNNKVNFLRGTATEYESSIKDNDTFYYTTDTEKLYLGDKEITGGGVTIDDALSDTSEHPVQNKVINAALNSKADQTAVDSALAQKANSADVTASLAGKSDTGHTHDDRYYTESETNTLLSDKVGVSDFNSHKNNTTVHVTAEEKAAWNGKAELADIPTTLPANGGNADTLDGKHANDFAQMRGDIADCDGAIAFGTYNITPETKNAPTADYYHLVVEPAANGAWIKQTAVLCNADAPLINSFTRININGTWSAWSNIADGGNALTATYASYANYAGTLANTASNICLRSLSSGTAAANTDNCPNGAWYGRYD